MDPVPAKLNPVSARIVAACAGLLLTCAAHADQNWGPDLLAQQDHGFFQRASRNVGNFFQRLFGTDEEKKKSQQPPPPPRGGTRSRGPRYNLDQPPSEAGTIPQSEPRYNSPPPDAPASSAAAKPKNKSVTPRNISPVDEPPKSKLKPTQSDVPGTGPSSAGNNPAPKTKTTKPSDFDANSSTSGSVASTKSPEPQPRTEPASTPSVPPPPKPAAESQNVLTGTKTNKAGRVKSPYAPYSELDVTGLPSGSLALDPTTQKVFRVP